MVKISSVSENAQEGSSEFARGGKGRIYIGEKKRREEEIGRRWKVGKPWEGEMIGGEEVSGLSPTSPPASWLQFLFRLPSLRGLSLRRSRVVGGDGGGLIICRIFYFPCISAAGSLSNRLLRI